MGNIEVRSGSAWYEPSDLKVYDGSSWQSPSNVWIYNGSSWNKFWPTFPTMATLTGYLSSVLDCTKPEPRDIDYGINGTIDNWDGGSYRLDIYIKSGSSSCSSDWRLLGTDVGVSGSSFFVEETAIVRDGEVDPINGYIATGSGDFQLSRYCDAHIVRRSDSADMDNMLATNGCTTEDIVDCAPA